MELGETYSEKIQSYFKSCKKTKLGVIILLFVAVLAGYFFAELRPVDARAHGSVEFQINPGDGFLKITSNLSEAHLIRSATAFKFFSILTGSALRIKSGLYELSPSMSSSEILYEIVSATHREVEVAIPSGASVYKVDKILSDAGVIKGGTLIAYNEKNPIDGKLFPDTYRFLLGSSTDDVVTKFLDNFVSKAMPELMKDKNNISNNLILASLVEKEVPTYNDRSLVAGILLKRLRANMPLQVDAAICYIKEKSSLGAEGCYPLSPLDFKIDSPYNTYLYKGLPPTPIGSPGLEAIRAVLEPESSPYWFYLSDPRTHKTVYSVTFEQHDQNRATYLR